MTIKINGDNSVANPGFTGADTDTGLKVGTDELTLVTGGSEALTVDFEGKVGIGTNAPEWALDVKRDINTLARFKRDTDGNSYIRLNSHGGNLAGFQLGDDTAIGKQSITSDNTNNALYFNTANFERVRIDSSGNVGIGTTGPDERLHLRRSDSAAVSLKFTNSAATTGLFVGINASEEAQIWHAENKTLKFATNNTEAMRISSSGNVGIGETNPLEKLVLRAVAASTGFSDTAISLQRNNYGGRISGYLDQGVGAGLTFSTTSNGHVTERMRLHSTGTLRFGQTTSDDPSGSNIVGVAVGYDYISCAGNNGNSGVFGRMGSDGSCVLFRRQTTNVGSISVNGSSTAYNTSSDYRLKENVVDLDGAINRVKQLAPKRFNFITDAETTVDGFLAHEAQAVVPEAVTGSKDEVDDDGNAVMQGIDQSKLVPLLTAALQEAISKIETLETQNADLLARVTALENA